MQITDHHAWTSYVVANQLRCWKT